MMGNKQTELKAVTQAGDCGRLNRNTAGQVTRKEC